MRKTITISLEADTINYFKMAAKKMGVPYQTLIHLCLNDIRDRELVPQLHWENKK
ncbi:MAG: BrnA antitoxin family protein [Saccharofermentans sp.]|nr:BrnA antitoxin family protein [Saccharofermentans sp.]